MKLWTEKVVATPAEIRDLLADKTVQFLNGQAAQLKITLRKMKDPRYHMAWHIQARRVKGMPLALISMEPAHPPVLMDGPRREKAKKR